MSPIKAYYTVVYWSRILSLPLYYNILLILPNTVILVLAKVVTCTCDKE